MLNSYSLPSTNFLLYPPVDVEVISVVAGSKRIGVTVNALTVCKNKGNLNQMPQA